MTLLENDKFVNMKGKVYFLRKRMNNWFADKDLSSWTGLGRSGHDRSPTFGQISHASGPKLTF